MKISSSSCFQIYVLAVFALENFSFPMVGWVVRGPKACKFRQVASGGSASLKHSQGFAEGSYRAGD